MHAGMTQQLQRPAHMPSNFTNNAGEGGTKHWRGLSRRLNIIRIGSWSSKLCLVGARGFEPPTPASRTQCATGLRYAPTKSTEPQSEGELSYISGSKRKPWASATPRQVILPPDRFTPFASPGSARTASSTPCEARRRRYGSVAFVNAAVDVHGTIPGIFATQ